MLRVVYIDVLFGINFIINYLILFAVGKLTGSVIRRVLIASGAIVGAIYCCVAYFYDMQFMWAMVAKAAVGSIMVVIAFGAGRNFLRLFLSFCGVSFAFGGCVLAIYFMTGGAGGVISMKNGVYYLKISFWLLVLSAGACYALISLVFSRCTAKGKGRGICEVRVENMGKTVCFQAIVDSGNHLKDPLTNRNVIIVEYGSIREILPKGTIDVLDVTAPKEFPMVIDRLPANCKFRLLPYKTIGCGMDMLLSFKPDRVDIDSKCVRGVLIAICPDRISDGGVYSAITSDAV